MEFLDSVASSATKGMETKSLSQVVMLKELLTSQP